jgi:hypothetical protein
VPPEQVHCHWLDWGIVCTFCCCQYSCCTFWLKISCRVLWGIFLILRETTNRTLFHHLSRYALFDYVGLLFARSGSSKCILLPLFTFDDQVGEGNDLNCETALPAHNDSVDDKTALVSDQWVFQSHNMTVIGFGTPKFIVIPLGSNDRMYSSREALIKHMRSI